MAKKLGAPLLRARGATGKADAPFPHTGCAAKKKTGPPCLRVKGAEGHLDAPCVRAAGAADKLDAPVAAATGRLGNGAPYLQVEDAATFFGAVRNPTRRLPSGPNVLGYSRKLDVDPKTRNGVGNAFWITPEIRH